MPRGMDIDAGYFKLTVKKPSWMGKYIYIYIYIDILPLYISLNCNFQSIRNK